MPSSRRRCRSDVRSPPPYAASTCSQILASADVADRGQRVDAAEVGGAGGRDDGDRQEAGRVAARELALEGVDPHPLGVVARHADDRVGARPRIRALFSTLKWPTSLTRIRIRCRSTAVSPCTAAASSRASSSACRLDWLPPLVKTPSASSPRPARPAVQSTSARSMRVAPALWSHVSIDVLTLERMSSPRSPG